MSMLAEAAHWAWEQRWRAEVARLDASQVFPKAWATGALSQPEFLPVPVFVFSLPWILRSSSTLESVLSYWMFSFLPTLVLRSDLVIPLAQVICLTLPGFHSASAFGEAPFFVLR